MTAAGCLAWFVYNKRSSENLKIKSGFQTTSFIQPTQAWGNSSSVGFAHKMNKNTAIVRINIRQVSWAKPTLLVAATATLSLPPSGGGRLGWGWLCSFRQNRISTAHRATLSPALSRQTGEGAGYTSRLKFLPNYRHFRVCGNPLLNLGN